VLKALPLHRADLDRAHARWERLRPTLSALFPLEVGEQGVIASPLRQTSDGFRDILGLPPSCTLLVKEDSKLAVCGSVKARGGLYETFAFAESVSANGAETTLLDAIRAGRMHDYNVVVGSTGNLGMSVGMAAAAMGMRSTIHMSKDAKAWKMKLLRERGCDVRVHEGSYGDAVAQGRRDTDANEMAHFVDDEQSETLFLGYACAAFELRDQMVAMGIDMQKHVVVHIPCGVGGAPSGICWGLKHIFGDAVTVLFAEPTHAPCVLLALGDATRGEEGEADIMSCADIGLDVLTEADGLACGKASPLCCTMVADLCGGIYTVDDESLFTRLAQLVEHEGETAFMEPSCCAALEGPRHLAWVRDHGNTVSEKEACARMLDGATHVIWATGGSLVPDEERQRFLKRGRRGSHLSARSSRGVEHKK